LVLAGCYGLYCAGRSNAGMVDHTVETEESRILA